jgi:hypothetical protein
VAADFNGDGRLDLAVANVYSNTVSVLLGNAGGTFQPPLTSTTGAGPKSMKVGDFNRDGKFDLVTANSDDVTLLLGNGNGSFQAPRNLGVNAKPDSIVVGDFNGDAKLDVAVSGNYYDPDEFGNYYVTPFISVLFGNGTGSFGAPQNIWSGTGDWYFIYHLNIAVGDFNGDGRHDVAAGVIGSGSGKVFLANGSGTFGAHPRRRGGRERRWQGGLAHDKPIRLPSRCVARHRPGNVRSSCILFRRSGGRPRGG